MDIDKAMTAIMEILPRTDPDERDALRAILSRLAQARWKLGYIDGYDLGFAEGTVGVDSLDPDPGVIFEAEGEALKFG